MPLPHRLLSVLLVGTLGVLGYLWATPCFFTPAKTLYERRLVKQEAGMDTDGLQQVALAKAVRYFELAFDKGYRSRDVFQNLYWCYQTSHNGPAVETARAGSGVLSHRPKILVSASRQSSVEAIAKQGRGNNERSDYGLS